MRYVLCFCVLMVGVVLWAGPENWTVDDVVADAALDEWYRVTVSTNVPTARWYKLVDTNGDGDWHITEWSLGEKQPTKEELRLTWEAQFPTLKKNALRAVAEKKWDSDVNIRTATKVAGKTKEDWIAVETNEVEKASAVSP